MNSPHRATAALVALLSCPLCLACGSIEPDVREWSLLVEGHVTRSGMPLQSVIVSIEVFQFSVFGGGRFVRIRAEPSNEQGRYRLSVPDSLSSTYGSWWCGEAVELWRPGLEPWIEELRTEAVLSDSTATNGDCRSGRHRIDWDWPCRSVGGEPRPGLPDPCGDP